MYHYFSSFLSFTTVFFPPASVHHLIPKLSLCIFHFVIAATLGKSHFLYQLFSVNKMIIIIQWLGITMYFVQVVARSADLHWPSWAQLLDKVGLRSASYVYLGDRSSRGSSFHSDG